MRGISTRRNWRWPIRFWLRSGREFQEFTVLLGASFALIAFGFWIIHRP